MKRGREIFWHRHQKGDGGGGWRVPRLGSHIKALYILLDPLPQHTLEDDRISQKVFKKKHVLEQATLLYWLPQSYVGKNSLSFSPWEPQIPFFFLRAPDPFLFLRDPGLLSNLPRNWLSQLWWIFHSVYMSMLLIAYSEWCLICDLQRRFSFGTRDQAWSLKSFCVAEFY